MYEGQVSQIYISYTPSAICILDENGNLVANFADLDEQLLKHVKNAKADKILTDSSLVQDFLGSEVKVWVEPTSQILKQWRANRFEVLSDRLGIVSSMDEYRELIKNKAMEETYAKLKQHASKKDELVAQIVHAVDDMQKTINLMTNRLAELYSLHFPELVEEISNPLTLAKCIAGCPQREALSATYLSSFGIPREKVDRIIALKDHSMGGDLQEQDLGGIQEYAKTLVHMAERKYEMEMWIEQQMNEIAPNITAVAGATVGARLISAMGSLRALALTHASKIQVIGAEKALYSSLRGRGSPPKHGIIFQIPEIGNSPFWIRGRIARAFASKIAIAARLDEFGGEFLGKQFREELREFEQQLRKQYPEPAQERK